MIAFATSGSPDWGRWTIAWPHASSRELVSDRASASGYSVRPDPALHAHHVLRAAQHHALGVCDLLALPVLAKSSCLPESVLMATIQKSGYGRTAPELRSHG
jgi:hypothetical protein